MAEQTIAKRARSEEYRRKLLDPRWQKRRLEILSRDEWSCQICGDSQSTLHVHHRAYNKGAEPWDYPDSLLVTLCADCHAKESAERYSYEQGLLYWLRCFGLYADDIGALTIAIASTEPQHLPEVVISAVCWALSDNDQQRELISRYFASLSSE